MNIDLLKFEYESVGFLHLPGILDAPTVSRVRTAFDAAAAAYREQWRREVSEGRANASFCDLPNILDQDEVFVNLVDLPTLVPVLLALVGPDVQLNHTHARLFPPGKTFTARMAQRSGRHDRH